MKDEDRRYTSLVYILSIICTLYSALKLESAKLVFIFVLI
jgi:hypothetical protein